jgi:hypothetical protein
MITQSRRYTTTPSNAMTLLPETFATRFLRIAELEVRNPEKSMPPNWLHLWVITCCASLVSCTSAGDRYQRALAAGPKDLEVVGQFVRVFPKALNSISYLSGEAGQTKWRSVSGLYGRYVLVMEIPISVDATGGHAVGRGEAQFHLFEVASLQYNPAQRTEEVTPGEVNLTFGPDKWKSVVNSHGDLEVLGIRLRRDKPVAGFAEYLERNFGEN